MGARRLRLSVAAGAVAILLAVPLAGTGAAILLAARHLPPLDLTPAAERSQVVLDREGQLLRPFTTPSGLWRLPVASREVDARLIVLIKAYEDRRFEDHFGVDPRAILRAAWQGLTNGRIVSGASTLTMQVARLLEPRDERSFGAKLRQMARALELERRLDKTQILDLYLALAPYGGNIEGVRAASLAYFGKEPRRLSLGEAALLVALPQSPETRRPDRFPAAARAARDRVIERMRGQGLVASAEAERAKAEPVPTARRPVPLLAPHLAEALVRAQPAMPVIRTTLDARMQRTLEALVKERVEALGARLSGAAIVLDNRTGEVRAHVGSADYLSKDRAGAVDAVQALRSPGSALKPFIYALAFEEGIAHPETLVEDRPSRYGAYAPENFDLGFQGVLTARRALQNSLNVPAVELLSLVGPDRFLARLRQAGADIAVPKDQPPGLAVGLGGVGIRLVDLARLYAGLARGGGAPEPRWLADGPDAAAHRLTDAVSAWYVSDVLRGAPPPVNAPAGQIAFKTGTSYGYRDAWAAGFDRRHTVAVWVGRPDNGPVPGLVGRQAAAPILFDAFARLGGEIEPVPQPPGVIFATTATLPPPLKTLRKDAPRALAVTAGAKLRIAYPPDGARVALGGAPTEREALAFKALGGAPPLIWFVNGAPVAGPELRRDASWNPDGAGFARVSVVDARGATDSVDIRLESYP